MPDTRGKPAPAMSEARRFQQPKAYLSYLKLNYAAEALNRVLDAARSERLSLTATLERLLEIRVTATEDRRPASRLRLACLPDPWTINDFDFDFDFGVEVDRRETDPRPGHPAVPRGRLQR